MKTAYMLCASVVLAGCPHPSPGSAASTYTQGPQTTYPGGAGTPTPASQLPAAAKQPPSDEELDRRDRLLANPRPEAGPPLRDSSPDLETGATVPVLPATDPTR
jgi:hypothetical protein